jgi:hypothetical protein
MCGRGTSIATGLRFRSLHRGTMCGSGILPCGMACHLSAVYSWWCRPRRSDIRATVAMRANVRGSGTSRMPDAVIVTSSKSLLACAIRTGYWVARREDSAIVAGCRQLAVRDRHQFPMIRSRCPSWPRQSAAISRAAHLRSRFIRMTNGGNPRTSGCNRSAGSTERG